MEEKTKNLQYRTKANDVDEKGIVTVAVNGIGVKDSQNDISMPGSFNKTLKENIGRMRWFRNHRTDLSVEKKRRVISLWLVRLTSRSRLDVIR